MPIRNGDYVQRTDEEVFETIVSELLNQEPDANPRAQSTLTYALIWSLAATIAQNQEQSLQDVYQSAYVVDATNEELTKKARNLGVIRQDAQKATGVVSFTRSSAATTDYTIPAGTIVETLAENPVQFQTTSPVTLASGTTSVNATIEALNGGSQGNVGPNSIQAMPSKPTGVEEVTNHDPTGDPSLKDTTGDPLREGRNREGDQALRDRVLNTDAVTVGPSADGIELGLESVDGLVSAHVNTNQTSSTTNGLDPYHSEVVVYGGDTYEVAVELYETMSGTTVLRLQGGVNGTKDSAVVHSRLFEQDITIPITRPNPLTFDLTLDVVHTSAYAGATAVRNAVVKYVGGTYVDGSTTTSLELGDNVLVNEIENRVEDVQGVEYADVTLLDTDGDGTDDTTTDSDGVPVLSVSDSEIPRVNADAITVNETAR